MPSAEGEDEDQGMESLRHVKKRWRRLLRMWESEWTGKM